MSSLLKLAFLILINAGIFYGLDYLFKETFVIEGGILGYIFVAILFGCVDSFIKPLINLITLPIRIISFGIIKFGINAGLLWLLEYSVNIFSIEDIKIQITGILTYFIIGLILATIDSIFDNF